MIDVDDGQIEVLVVEDNPAHAHLIDIHLGQLFNLSFAGCMRQAERRCAEALPDIVLQDLCLPDEFGLDTVARSKRMAPGVPIVILSDYVSDEFRLAVVDDQVVEALNKSDVNPPAIIRVLQTAILREEARIQARVSRTLSKVVRRIRHRLAAYTAATEGRS